MGKLVYSFENNGDTIPLSNVVPKDFFKSAGSSGFGIAPTSLEIKEGAGAGGRWRSTRRGPRSIDLPITIFGKNEQDIEDKMRRLARLWNDDESSPFLVVKYPDGTEFEIEIHFAGGADPQYGIDSDMKNYCRWPVSLEAPKPYFIARTARQYSIRAANAGRGLIKNTSLTKLQMSSSQTIGSVTVENDGDVAAFPVWTVKGPGDFFQATLPNGQSFRYDSPILVNEIITIDTVTKKVTDQNGTNRYTDLATAPKLFPIPRGETSISIFMDNTTSASVVGFFFRERRELVFG